MWPRIDWDFENVFLWFRKFLRQGCDLDIIWSQKYDFDSTVTKNCDLKHILPWLRHMGLS